ncbi:type II toxin-antitoxin system RelE/ParE family toxin [Rothia nasimurium]|uniref:type II toxin-antitoxin system RelE/ParE family toxin n=1 Tax=Rothia nasimurium TaxID=85336 RepID=UPI001F16E544|nr:type II toxin-antitoxin system RelE/ParE family toxin [Rothia nasimurium]
MLIEYEDEELQKLAEDASYSTKRFGSALVAAYRKKIGLIRAAVDERDLRAYKALRLEKLAGDREGQSSIRLNQQYRLILKFKTVDPGRITVVIEIVDYH